MGATVYSSGEEVRLAARDQLFSDQTSGQASGYVQANLVILPQEWAFDFLLFAQRNPKPCPVLEVGDVGVPYTRYLADGADIRSDLPKYSIYRKGELSEQVLDIHHLWQKNFVFFLLGCSFTFEHALMASGLTLRHIEEKVNVPMYKTSIPCQPAGKFQPSPMVVSMRPFKGRDVVRSIEITRDFPSVHGSPVHVGDPSKIGIDDLGRPDWGDAITVAADETPVFWACGVTPQLAATVARPPLMITHAAGHMFVGDKLDSDFRL